MDGRWVAPGYALRACSLYGRYAFVLNYPWTIALCQTKPSWKGKLLEKEKWLGKSIHFRVFTQPLSHAEWAEAHCSGHGSKSKAQLTPGQVSTRGYPRQDNSFKLTFLKYVFTVYFVRDYSLYVKYTKRGNKRILVNKYFIEFDAKFLRKLFCFLIYFYLLKQNQYAWKNSETNFVTYFLFFP